MPPAKKRSLPACPPSVDDDAVSPSLLLTQPTKAARTKSTAAKALKGPSTVHKLHVDDVGGDVGGVAHTSKLPQYFYHLVNHVNLESILAQNTLFSTEELVSSCTALSAEDKQILLSNQRAKEVILPNGIAVRDQGMPRYVRIDLC
jgi:hypothetical protein